MDENNILDFTSYSPEKDIYSDGDIEQEILNLVNIDGFNPPVSEKRWPVFYHLAKDRENLLSWYEFKSNSKLLEIGSGCGALTGLFSERVNQVYCVESSKQRASIAAKRYKNKDNIRIKVGDFMDMRFSTKFDYITLIGVLEYAPMFMPKSSRPFHDMIKKCLSYLSDNGELLIAIENRYGLKYWSGAEEDHLSIPYVGIENYPNGGRARTFNKKELKDLLKDSGVDDIEWYYPYPDYKFPCQIFTDYRLPRKEDFIGNVYSLDVPREVVFDEIQVYREMPQEYFPIFANSFLVKCTKE